MWHADILDRSFSCQRWLGKGVGRVKRLAAVSTEPDMLCVMCLTGVQQRSFHIVHYGTRRRGCPLIDPVGFDKQHDIGEYCGLIT